MPRDIGGARRRQDLDRLREAEVVDRGDRVFAGVDRRRATAAVSPPPWRGRVRTKFEPRPSSRPHRERPAVQASRRRARSRARDPCPRSCAVREGSARQNRSKTRSASVGLHARGRSRARRARPPAGCCRPSRRSGRPSPCSIALPSRLRTTRRTRRGSMSTGEYPPGATRRTSVPCCSASWRIDAMTSSARCARLVGLELELNRSGVIAADLEQVGRAASRTAAPARSAAPPRAPSPGRTRRADR